MASWSGFWGDSATTTGSYALLSSVNGRSAAMTPLRIALRKPGLRKMRELFDAAARVLQGEAVAKSYSRIQGEASPGNITGGGVRTIESVDVFGGATTATQANEDMVLAHATFDPGHNLPVEDSSGNGGGGKLGL